MEPNTNSSRNPTTHSSTHLENGNNRTNIVESMKSSRFLAPLSSFYESFIHQASPKKSLFLIISFIVIAVSPFRLYFLAGALLIFLGYAIAAPNLTQEPPKWDKYFEHMMRSFPLRISAMEDTHKLDYTKELKLLVSDDVYRQIQEIVDLFIQDFINYWYVHLNLSGKNTFQAYIKNNLLYAFGQLFKFVNLKNFDLLSLIIYGVINGIIIHLREFRKYQNSNLSLENYIIHTNRTTRLSSKSRSKYSHSSIEPQNYFSISELNVSEELSRLSTLSELLITRLLPKKETQSVVLASLLQEILSCSFLYPAIHYLSKPHTLNRILYSCLCSRTSLFSSHFSPLHMEDCWLLELSILQMKNVPFFQSNSSEFYFIFTPVLDSAKSSYSIKTNKINLNYDISLPTIILPLHIKIPRSLIQNASPMHNNAFEIRVAFMNYSLIYKDRLLSETKFYINLSKLKENKKDRLYISLKLKDFVSPIKLLTKIVLLDSDQESSANESKHQTSKGTLREKDEQKRTEPAVVPSLDDLIQKNDLFAKFYEFMTSINASNLLQFWMNADSYRRFALMEMDAPYSKDSMEELLLHGTHYDGKKKLSLQQMLNIRRDALDVYFTHFSSSSEKFRVSYIGEFVSPYSLSHLKTILRPSLNNDEFHSLIVQKKIKLWNIGPNIFDPFKKEVYDILRKDYYPKFIQFWKELYADTWYQNETISQLQQHKAEEGEDQVKKLYSCISDSSLFDIEVQNEGFEEHPQTPIEIVSEEALDNQRDNVIHRKDYKNANFTITACSPSFIDSKNRNSIFTFDFTPLPMIPSSYAFEIIFLNFDLNEEGHPLIRTWENFKLLHHKLLSLIPEEMIRAPFPESLSSLELKSLIQNLENYLKFLLTHDAIIATTPMTSFLNSDISCEALSKFITSKSFNRNRKNFRSKFIEVFKKVPSLLQTIARTSIDEISGVSKPIHDSANKEATIVEERELKRKDETALNPDIPSPSSSPLETKSDHHSSCSSTSSSNLNEFRIESTTSLSDSEMILILETLFALIEEVFELTDKSQWLKRKIFSIFKQIIKQLYGDSLQKLLNDLLTYIKSELFLKEILFRLRHSLWDESGIWKGMDAAYLSINETFEAGSKEEEEFLKVQDQTRSLLLKQSPELLYYCIGKYNTVYGLNTLFNMMQHQLLNKKLIYIGLDIAVKLIFSEEK